MPKLHIYKNEKDTCYAFAEWFSELVNESLAKQEKFMLALPGNEVPRVLFKTLGADFSDKTDWSRVHVFMETDQVSGTANPGSNPSITTILENIPVAKNQLHLVGSSVPPDGFSTENGGLLKRQFNDNGLTFDLAILGLSEQGDFAVQPRAEESRPTSEWIISNNEERGNVVLTSDVINAAAVKAFVITGKRKQDIVQQVLKGKYEPEKFPAQLIQTVNKTVHWFMDEAAAGKLIKPAS